MATTSLEAKVTERQTLLKDSALDLGLLPTVYLLASHLSIDEQHEIEDKLILYNANVTYDIAEAQIIIGNIAQPRRAKIELQWKGISFDEDPEVAQTQDELSGLGTSSNLLHPKKRNTEYYEPVGRPPKAARKAEDEQDTEVSLSISRMRQHSSPQQPTKEHESALDVMIRQSENQDSNAVHFLNASREHFLVLRLEWLDACTKAQAIALLDPFVLLEACKVAPGMVPESRQGDNTQQSKRYLEKTAIKIPAESHQGIKPVAIIERAKADPRSTSNRSSKRERIADLARQDFEGKSYSTTTKAKGARGHAGVRPVRLVHQTTSENEETLEDHLPPMPNWVKENRLYSCERLTPADSPNEAFIGLLKKIRTARELTLDQIGVRSYSTSIASLMAYPYRLQSSREVLALPGCNRKIAQLFHEYKTNSGRLQAVDEIDADPALTVLQEFYNIWGVGAATARDFYYDKEWRDLDDIIEHGWESLNRVQQIGLKYYDDFLLPIPRSDVEAIATIIKEHAVRVSNDKIQCAIVGGYRRGKPFSGDVDVILSHPDPRQTLSIVDQIVKSLETEGWVTHTLITNHSTSKRDQETLPLFSGSGGGFDTLDKALVVWQDPRWPTVDVDKAANPKAKNPNVHRRVDIIISPWRTVGCAVAGWTSGTTFQRDLRRYCKHVKGWKFDSSGVRERGSGKWVDLEGWTDEKTRCRTWEEAEKRMFQGLGLIWREPWERCTG